MYNFEFHITVDADEYQLDAFRRVCQEINAKAIVINPQGANNQVMTSSTIRLPDLDSAITLIRDQSRVLVSNGLKIVREKIESCPKFIAETGNNFHYWEIHVPCHTSKLDEVMPQADLMHQWHRSRNEFKQDVTMLTFRSKDVTLDQVMCQEDIVSMMECGMVTSGFKNHIEYVVFDTNIDLDNDWLHKSAA